MAHFTYPSGTPLGTVPFGYVVPSAEWQSTIRQVFRAINGDEGGTWAPSTYIVVGGSGFSLTGTGHQIAASARLTVQSTGEIRVANGGLVRLDGAGGDILMSVTANVATIEVESGALVKIDAGGAFDVYGSATFKSGGTGQWESGSDATFLLGSTLTLASGATANLTGSTVVRGTFTIKASGGPGSLVIESGTTNNVAGLVQFLGTAEQRFSAGSTLTGAIEVSGGASSVTLKDGVDIALDTPVAWSSARVILHVLSYAGAPTGPSNPDMWSETSDLFNAPCFRTTERTGTGGKSVLEFVDLPPGGSIAQVTVTTKGTNVAGVASILPKYQIVSWEDSSANGYTTHSTLTVDDAAELTFAADPTQTTITVSSPVTVVAGRHYGIGITHPYEAVFTQGVRVYEATMSGTTTTYRK